MLIVGKTGKDKCMHIKIQKQLPLYQGWILVEIVGEVERGAALNPLSGSTLPLTSEIVWHLIRQ